MDWKDMLSQLRDNLPEGADNAQETGPASEVPATGSKSVKKEKIHIVIEKKGRKGKTATIAEGFKCSDEELQDIASNAKRHLGVGGSARGGEILIQGECKERLAAFLKNLGYSVC